VWQDHIAKGTVTMVEEHHVKPKKNPLERKRPGRVICATASPRHCEQQWEPGLFETGFPFLHCR